MPGYPASGARARGVPPVSVVAVVAVAGGAALADTRALDLDALRPLPAMVARPQRRQHHRDLHPTSSMAESVACTAPTTHPVDLGKGGPRHRRAAGRPRIFVFFPFLSRAMPRHTTRPPRQPLRLVSASEDTISGFSRLDRSAPRASFSSHSAQGPASRDPRVRIASSAEPTTSIKSRAGECAPRTLLIHRRKPSP